MEKLQITNADAKIWEEALKRTTKITWLSNQTIQLEPLGYATLIEIQDTKAEFLIQLGMEINKIINENNEK